MTSHHATIPSPLGPLFATCNGSAITSLRFVDRVHSEPASSCESSDAFIDLRRQLDLYWAGRLQRFDIPLELSGTSFQLDAWRALAEIPYGCTQSYMELASRIGRPRAIRAVGRANGANPISIILPCHRVIGSDGSLTGYGGGIERKLALLKLEGARAS